MVNHSYRGPVVVPRGASMTTIKQNSDESAHDYAWHRTHRARRGGQSIDVVMLAGMGSVGRLGVTAPMKDPGRLRAPVLRQPFGLSPSSSLQSFCFHSGFGRGLLLKGEPVAIPRSRTAVEGRRANTQTITVVTILSPAYRGSPIQLASARPPHLPFGPRKSVSTLRIGIRYHHDPVHYRDVRAFATGPNPGGRATSDTGRHSQSTDHHP